MAILTLTNTKIIVKAMKRNVEIMGDIGVMIHQINNLE